MAERFDPYYKWLGIPLKDQPPSHYRLLGLELFESDAEVIDRAANRLMDYLHSISDGEHLAHAQALLNEISAARLCLLDAGQRAEYDERLRAEEAASKADRAARGEVDEPADGDDSGEHSAERSARTVRGKRALRAKPPAPPPPVAFPPTAPPVHRPGSGREHQARAKKSSAPLLIGLAGCTLLAAGVAVVWVMMRGEPQKPAATKPDATKPDTVASSRGPRDVRPRDSSPPASNGLDLEPPAKSDVDSFPGEPAKTADPPVSPPPKQEPPSKEEGPSKPEPEGDLFAAAKEAVKKKNAKEALELLEKYVRDPAAPQADEAAKWLVVLRDISSDEVILRQMSQVSDAQLLEAEQGRLTFKNTLVPELDELFNDAIRRNIPETKRRRGMMAEAPKAKQKAPGDKTAGDPAPNPTTPDPATPVPDPLAKPAEFLASQGLTQRGMHWQLNEDAALAAMAGITDLERKYTQAAGKFAKELKAFNQLRVQYSQAIQQDDVAKQQNRKTSPQVVQFLNEWRPKIGDKIALGNYADLRTMLLGRIVPRTDLLVAVLKAHKALDPLEEKYAALAADSRVTEALSKLPGEKAGPSTKCTQVRAKFAKAEALVLADETLLYLKDRDALLCTVVNETPADLAFLPSQNFNVMTEELVKKLGIAIPADAPAATIERSNINGEKQKVPGRIITIASIRLGKHVLKDLQFIVTGPQGADMGSGLGSPAFSAFRTEADYDNFVFKIRPQDAPEPEPQKKGKR